MKPRPSLADLQAFTAIVAHHSFRKAAEELSLSPSTLSHMMRTLEAAMGVRLLHRTTRSLSPTEAGERLLARLQPVLRDLDVALEEVNRFRDRPAGQLRINASETAARRLLHTVVPTFLARFPDMDLDLVTEGRLIDIVAEGFDAGIRLGEAVPQDMVAVRFGGAVRFVAVASPGYLATHPAPQTPHDLKEHRCIQIRLPSGKPYQWEFERHGQALTVDFPGQLTLDHPGLMAECALKDMGIAFVSVSVVQPYLNAGQLVEVLADWCPAVAGLFLYYAGHRHVPAGLRAFIEVLKEHLPNDPHAPRL
jgi:DNA-binding transcriptional LysR family regulator